jgi:hypothetical protein
MQTRHVVLPVKVRFVFALLLFLLLHLCRAGGGLEIYIVAGRLKKNDL